MGKLNRNELNKNGKQSTHLSNELASHILFKGAIGICHFLLNSAMQLSTRMVITIHC